MTATSDGALDWASSARNRSSQRSSRASSANRTSSVLSPASVPSCSSRVDSSMAWAIVEAVPGRADQEQDQPAPADRDRDVGEDPPEAVVGPRRPDGEVLRRDVDVAVAARDLDQAELGDVARDRRLGDRVAAPAELLGELALAADRHPGDQLADGPLAIDPRPGGRPVAHRRSPQAAPTRGERLAVRRVPKVGSSSARARASGAEASAMIASAPSQPSAARAARILGTIPPAIVPASMSASASPAVSAVEPPAVGVADAVDVGQQDELAGAESGGDPGRDVVGVDVAHDAVLVPRERRDDRHLAGRRAASRAGRGGARRRGRRAPSRAPARR